MPIRPDKRNIPHLAEAIDRYITVRSNTIKDIASERSVLQGPSGKVVGKQAAGHALAKTSFAGLRCDRVTDQQLHGWFADRHEDLKHNTKRRGMNSLRRLIEYCIGQGWMEDRMITSFTALPKVDSADRDWLRPEMLVPLMGLIDDDAHFDAYQRFAFYTFLTTGVRPAELIKLKRSSLDPRTCVLTVVGKGRGDGKRRPIPVPATYCDRWLAHATANRIAPGGWMFFHRAPLLDGGRNGSYSYKIDKTKHATAQPFRRMLAHHETDQRAPSLQDLAQQHLPADVAPAFQLTPVVLRRTFACLALIEHVRNPGNGWDLRTLQVALGHSGLTTTQLYLADVETYLGKHRGQFDAVEAARDAASALTEPSKPDPPATPAA